MCFGRLLSKVHRPLPSFHFYDLDLDNRPLHEGDWMENKLKALGGPAVFISAKKRNFGRDTYANGFEREREERIHLFEQLLPFLERHLQAKVNSTPAATH